MEGFCVENWMSVGAACSGGNMTHLVVAHVFFF